MPSSSGITPRGPLVSSSLSPKGLHALLKQRLQTALMAGPPGAWKVLVVDDYSRELLESVYKLFDVLHMNITCEFLASQAAHGERQVKETEYGRTDGG